jgi:hypothetical protein
LLYGPAVTFRSDYLDYSALSAQLRTWAELYPDFVRLRSLTKTPEGRDLWLLIIGREPERVRPAAWVDGNMHAGELAGSSVALTIAEDLITLLRDGALPGLPDAIGACLREGLFYILPRISPDGAECVLKTGRYVRSVPRDARLDRGRPRWRCHDLDEDGSVRTLRVLDPGGEFVESPIEPGLMVQRELSDAGPFYKLYPEGSIEHFDGRTIPNPDFFVDNPVDLNRNFPWHWAPEHDQAGAGPFPASEPESRAIVEFATAHPEIFVWLNLHTYGGVGIRPLGHAPDEKMVPFDLAVYRQIEHWLEQITGYPMVSGYQEFLYEPDKPLHGDLTDYAYNQRGAIAYVIELWDLFARLGKARPKRFVDHYTRLERADLERLARWDREENGGKLQAPWRPFEHPQLGRLEVGGMDPLVGVWNPSLSALGEVCERQSRCFLHVAALAPRLRLSAPKVTALGEGVSKIEWKLENHGYLPTFILQSAEKLDFNEPVHVDCATEGLSLVDPGQAHQVLGHLAGWGTGRFTGFNTPSHQRSRGNGHSVPIVCFVRGRGTLRIRAGACRVGWVTGDAEIG